MKHQRKRRRLTPDWWPGSLGRGIPRPTLEPEPERIPLAALLPPEPPKWYPPLKMSPAMLVPVHLVETSATHAPTGAQFRLLLQPDGKILAVQPSDQAATDLIATVEHPGAWCNREQWWVDPPQTRKAVG